jgi:hypothetical protein
MSWTEYCTPQARNAAFARRYGRESLGPLYPGPEGLLLSEHVMLDPMPGPSGPLAPGKQTAHRPMPGPVGPLANLTYPREPMPGPLGVLAQDRIRQLGNSALNYQRDYK